MKRLNHLHLAVAPRTLYRKLEELGSTFDSKLKDWIANGQFLASMHAHMNMYDVCCFQKYLMYLRKCL